MATSKVVRLSLFLALSMATIGVSAADWIRLSSNADGDTIFLDRGSIRNNGGILQVWTMTNLGTQRPDGTLSQKTAFLLNCQTWEAAVWSGVSYSAPNGEGQLLNHVTASPNEINYEPTIPDSSIDAILKFSCSSSK